MTYFMFKGHFKVRALLPTRMWYALCFTVYCQLSELGTLVKWKKEVNEDSDMRTFLTDRLTDKR